jgi:prefoldin subunit 4
MLLLPIDFPSFIDSFIPVATTLPINTIQKEMEGLDDASTELMMTAGGDKVLLMTGEAFFETNEEKATEFCEAQVEKVQQKMDALAAEETTLRGEQEKLKVILYGRFGKSINLEEDEPAK